MILLSGLTTLQMMTTHAAPRRKIVALPGSDEAERDYSGIQAGGERPPVWSFADGSGLFDVWGFLHAARTWKLLVEGGGANLIRSWEQSTVV